MADLERDGMGGVIEMSVCKLCQTPLTGNVRADIEHFRVHHPLQFAEACCVMSNVINEAIRQHSISFAARVANNRFTGDMRTGDTDAMDN